MQRSLHPAMACSDGEGGVIFLECDMSKLSIPHDAFVFVGDGRKALFLRNEGDEKFPNLVTERVFVDENPPTHEQGPERPRNGPQRYGDDRLACNRGASFCSTGVCRSGGPRARARYASTGHCSS